MYNFHLDPWYSKFMHSRNLGYQIDRTEVNVSKIFLKGIDLEKLYEFDYLDCDQLDVRGLDVNDHRDKRVPDRQDFYPPMPQEILRNIDFKFKIDSVTLSDGSITYEEYVEGGKRPGEVSFTDMEATVWNLT